MAKDSAGLSGMDQIALFVRGMEASLSTREARQQLTTALTRRIQHCSFTGHATVTAMKEYRRRHSLEPMGNVIARGAPLLTEGPSATSSTTDKAPSPQGPKPTPADKFANPLPVAVV